LFTYDFGLPTYYESVGRKFESCRARQEHQWVSRNRLIPFLFLASILP
jgi:hypothetical protein